jgi:type I restriction enzyme S subunit
MAGDGWRRLSIDQVKAPKAGAIAIGPFGSRMKSDRYEATGVPVIRGNNISDARALTGDFAYVSQATADELRVSNVFPGDLVFPHRGAIGRVGVVPNDGEPRYMLSTSLMKLTCDPAVVDPAFLFYFFRSGQGQHELLRNASTVGTPGIGQPLASLRSITVPVPPLIEQLAIAHILGTLDDKIELNGRMNETLEAIARALFKSWFVDFDPVRAKSEGRDPGLPPHLAGLFPDSFEHSEAEMIPVGWGMGSVGDLARRVVDKIEDARKWHGEPLIDLGRMPQRGIALTDWGLGGELTTSITRFRVRDTLFGAIRPYFHKVGIAPMDGVTNISVFVLRAKHETDWSFVAMLCSMDATVAHATRVSKGTKMPVVSWTDFAAYETSLPPMNIRAAFCHAAAPQMDRIVSNVRESRALAALRDSLLPKLISGELRVTDAERLVETRT